MRSFEYESDFTRTVVGVWFVDEKESELKIFSYTAKDNQRQTAAKCQTESKSMK